MYSQVLLASLREQIKCALDEAGIEIPFPHLQLFVDGAQGLEPVLKPWHPPGKQKTDAD